jgi:hypothetical protein
MPDQVPEYACVMTDSTSKSLSCARTAARSSVDQSD